jgi:hypothetical protein
VEAKNSGNRAWTDLIIDNGGDFDVLTPKVPEKDESNPDFEYEFRGEKFKNYTVQAMSQGYVEEYFG